MKTGFREHLLASLIPVFLFLFFVSNSLGFPIILAPLIFILSSLVPDLDHPKSIPRKFVRIFIFAILFMACILTAIFFQVCGNTDCRIIILAITLLLSLLFVLALESAIPKHRGKIHSKEAAAFSGLLVFLISASIMPVPVSFLFGLSSFAGYLFHLLVDFIGDRI